MKDKVIDMTKRKEMKIIYKKKEVEQYIDNRATLKLKTEINESCVNIDPIGICTVQNCLTCSNCDYKIVLNNGIILKDYQYEKDAVEEKYVIEFFDELGNSNIVDYLNNEESNYRITRDSDRIILRYSKEDIIKRDARINQTREDMDGIYQAINRQIEHCELEEQKYDSVEKRPSLVKKIKSIFKKTIS